MKKVISGAGVGAMGVAAAVIALAPAASAASNNGLDVSGVGYTVGQTYILTANVALGGFTAVFYDNNVEIGRAASAIGQGTVGDTPVTLAWTPTTSGKHTITEKTVDPFLGIQIGTEGPVTLFVTEPGSGSATLGLTALGSQSGIGNLS